MKHLPAQVVAKAVAIAMPDFHLADQKLKFHELFLDELQKHVGAQGFRRTSLPGIGDAFEVEFKSGASDKELKDFVNRCRRTAMRRAYGNTRRKERDEQGKRHC